MAAAGERQAAALSPMRGSRDARPQSASRVGLMRVANVAVVLAGTAGVALAASIVPDVVARLALALASHGAWALKAAGAFKGHAIGGIEHFVSALQGNVIWLGGTAMGLIIAVVGILFLAGHSRAHDVALKTLIGLAILASVGGIVA